MTTKQLIDNHLIGHYIPAENAYKAHYRISVENLIHFIDKYYEPKKRTTLRNKITRKGL